MPYLLPDPAHPGTVDQVQRREVLTSFAGHLSCLQKGL